MATPPVPPLLEHLAGRPFSFYPPILNIRHNQWRFLRATWPEILVVNSKTGEEVAIPRRFIAEVARIHDPVLIVGLARELEYRAGAVWPHQRRVLEMPLAVNAPAGPHLAQEPPRAAAEVVAIRLEPLRRRGLRVVAIALAGAIALSVLAVSLRDSRRFANGGAEAHRVRRPNPAFP